MKWFFSALKKKPAQKHQILKLRTIPGDKPHPEDAIRSFKTKVVGVSHTNDDGSSRQSAIKSLRVGQRVQLAWDPSNRFDKNAILVFGDGDMSSVRFDSCIGHLKADLAADMVALIKSNKCNGMYATVAKKLKATEDFEMAGCLIEVVLY